MTIFFILLGTLLCSIVITTVQIRTAQRKEMDEINQLFDEPTFD